MHLCWNIMWCRDVFMTLSLIGNHREAQLQVLKKPRLVLASFHDTVISHGLFIYLFSGSCSWWDIFGHLGEEAETDDLSCCTLLIRTIPSDLHLYRFNFDFESWVDKHFLYMIAYCSLILRTNTTLALSFFSMGPPKLLPLLVIDIYQDETGRVSLAAMTTLLNIKQFCHSTSGTNG